MIETLDSEMKGDLEKVKSKIEIFIKKKKNKE